MLLTEGSGKTKILRVMNWWATSKFFHFAEIYELDWEESDADKEKNLH